ncbi:MAG: FAD-binding oxidoreductase [Thermoleophilaceae bacterium]
MTTELTPLMVAAPTGIAEVQAAVQSAREDDLPVLVRSTGHGTHVDGEGALLLDTSGLGGVVIDPERRVARVGAGATWGQVLAAAEPFGLAPLSGSSPTVGVVGFTLGGGVGWLSRKHGFAADSLVRAAMVSAAGELVIADAEREPELFWALRGGGGSLGVVTGLELRLFPVRDVYAGASYFDAERAPDTLARYADWIADAPDELSTALLVTRVEDRPLLAIRAMYSGAADEAERLLAPLREVAGPALVEGFASTTYAEARMGGTPPVHVELLNGLPDALIEPLVGAVTEGRATTVELRHWGGAMSRPAADAGPVGHRETPLSVIADVRDPELAGELEPWATGGSFLNFLKDTTRTRTAYTPADWRRLREVKASWDPDNVFSLNHSIPPARARDRLAA